MRKSKKQLLRTMMACGLVISVAAGDTVAYLTDAETTTNLLIYDIKEKSR